MGCLNHENRDEAGLIRAFERAKAGDYHAILFAPSILDSGFFRDALSRCRDANLEPIVQLDWTLLEKLPPDNHTFSLSLVFDGTEAVDWDVFKKVEQSYVKIYLTLAPFRGTHLKKFIERAPAWVRGRIDYNFSPYSEKSGNGWPVVEVHRELTRLTKSFPELVLHSPQDRDVWDSRISPDYCLEPMLPLTFSSRLNGARIRVSVVIPSYNSGKLLKNVVHHLLDQALPREEFEIIIVDDGSTDQTVELIRPFTAPEASPLNLKFIHFPRPCARKMGDGHFRAGIARNLGVKYAEGELLCFLDADIIIPKNFLERVLAAHETAEVVQYVRMHVKPPQGCEQIKYEEINPSSAFILEKNYWGPFFKTRDWQSMPYYWKYTCTYALSLPTALFKNTGGFRRTFVYYGFEDTDLGYRLAKAGARFFLNPLLTYHLTEDSDRSEYGNSSYQRHKLLSKTAKVFYLNTLDPKVYSHFRSFMRGERGLRDIALRLRRRLRL